MIHIRKSPTSDTRTCDYANVSRETLYRSSEVHIGDVRQGLDFFINMLRVALHDHDFDKLTQIDQFHADFVNGFRDGHTSWWENHRKLNRHHLNYEDGVREDVHLVDVIEYIVDCVMAGMARTGGVYPLEISDELLRRAFNNTVDMLIKQVRVQE